MLKGNFSWSLFLRHSEDGQQVNTPYWQRYGMSRRRLSCKHPQFAIGCDKAKARTARAADTDGIGGVSPPERTAEEGNSSFCNHKIGKRVLRAAASDLLTSGDFAEVRPRVDRRAAHAGTRAARVTAGPARRGRCRERGSSSGDAASVDRSRAKTVVCATCRAAVRRPVLRRHDLVGVPI